MMNEPNYWASIRATRISRRRAMGGAAAGMAAIALAACGGSDETAPSSSASNADKSGLIAQAEDSTKQAMQGGIYQSYRIVEQQNLDPLTAPTGASVEAKLGYNTLLRNKPGFKDDKSLTADVEGGVAQSWEVSPDHLTVTLKIRPNQKLDPRTPTNSRLVDSGDVLYSWNRFSKGSGSQSDLLNSLSADAPIKSLEAPDKDTVVIKLAFPFSPILIQLAHFRYFTILPVEADGKYDARNDVRGSGPFMMTKYEPSVAFEFRRNPDWYEKGQPFLDGIDQPIITEYAQRLAQLKAKKLWTADVRAEDVLATKKESPEMLMTADPGYQPTSAPYLGFSQRADSPFQDVRVRRALSMLFDRDLWLDTFENLQNYKKQGIEVDSRMHSHIGAGTKGYWIDPRSKEMGEGAAYFKYNPDEAKKLLQAAGITAGLPTRYAYRNQGDLKPIQALVGMASDSGLFKLNEAALDPNTDWQTQCHRAKGNYDGLCSALSGAPASTDVDVQLMVRIFSGPGEYTMFPKPLDNVQQMIIKQRQEFDVQKRVDIVKDLQREMAVQMPAIPFPFGVARGFKLSWPWFRNFQYFVGSSAPGIGDMGDQDIYPRYWYDKSKDTSK